MQLKKNIFVYAHSSFYTIKNDAAKELVNVH